MSIHHHDVLLKYEFWGLPVDARDRIGEGPWHNANGLIVATNLETLHYDNSHIRYEYALNERGQAVPPGFPHKTR